MSHCSPLCLPLQLTSLCIAAEPGKPTNLVSLRAVLQLPALRRCLLGAGSLEGSASNAAALPAARCAGTLRTLAARGRELALLSGPLAAASRLEHVVMYSCSANTFWLGPYLAGSFWDWAHAQPALATLDIQLEEDGCQLHLTLAQALLPLKDARPAMCVSVGCGCPSDYAREHFAHPVGGSA